MTLARHRLSLGGWIAMRARGRGARPCTRATGRANGRRMARIRRRPREHQVRAAGSDRCRQLRQAEDRLAMEVGGRVSQQDRSRRGGVVDEFGLHLRPAERGGSEALERQRAAHRRELQGHADHGGREAVSQHADVGRRRDRCAYRRDDLDLQPQELREGHDHHERPVEPARRGVLDRRQAEAHFLGHGGRLPDCRRCRHRPPGAGLRQRWPCRSDERPSPGLPRFTRLAQRAHLLRAVASHRRSRYGDHACVDLLVQHHEGADRRMDSRL